MSAVRSSRLPGLVLVRTVVHSDARGFFVETYHRDRYRSMGVDAEFVQDNHSRSTRGTLRGLHYQATPGQAKLVRVARGRVWDVAVDLRRSSPTFGQWEAFELDDVDHLQLYIPIGFAHGYVALSDEVDFVYKVGSYYDPTQERGVVWDDQEIGVAWPVAEPLVSERDRSNPTLREAMASLPEW